MQKSKLIHEIHNGENVVMIYEDGTKVRLQLGEPKFPESIDLKITNYCDMFKVCKWCHEQSDVDGWHGNLLRFEDTNKEVLPEGTELAIGGGNPLSHPMLPQFLASAYQRGWIPNLTVNAAHVGQLEDEVTKNIYGLGVSYSRMLSSNFRQATIAHPHVVAHLIIGIHELEDLEEVIKWTPRVLLLGYKRVGNGKKYWSADVKHNIGKWKQWIRSFKPSSDVTVAFDNLAIEQLRIREMVSEAEWNATYMGDDGTHSMFIDLVDKTYGISSRHGQTYSGLMNVEQMFREIRSRTGTFSEHKHRD